ncbi:hypothetical protein SteCoe_19275 [Stentor coeruleus]|uniref:dual-specificity kinase n=1 Tax=Stentor coeruleus TaxID=5963 RepID=A0A1R2BUH2_9CILI|nr:hypothetical protein SteCoe_19275 [Stentor coeruleus]
MLNQDLHKAYEELSNPHAVPVPESRKNLVLEIINHKRSNLASLHYLYPYKYRESPISAPKPEPNESVCYLLNTSDTLSQPRSISPKQKLIKTQSNVSNFHLKSFEKAIKIPKHSVTRNQFPMFPNEVLKLYPDIFPPWEQAEILNYSEIYYIGIPGSHEYKDFHTESSYKIIQKDHIAYRYEIIKIIGKGAFGEVIQAFDHYTKQDVAIKILKRKTRNTIKGHTEIQILEYIKNADHMQKSNIVNLISHFEFRKHICLVFDLYSLNLYEVIKKNSYKGLDKEFIYTVGLQVLQALQFLYRHHIIHCDIKPENILLEKLDKLNIKLIDFGSACFNNKKIHSYFQSRFYRAPEVILRIGYTHAIDIWSFGCLLAELLMGVSLFIGDSEADQLNCIMEVLGPVPLEMISASPQKDIFFDENNEPRTKVNSYGKIRIPNSRLLRDLLRGKDEECVKVIENCLKWDPAARISIEDALNCDFFIRKLGEITKTRKHRQISMDEITKNTPGLRRFIARRDRNSIVDT